ncbi:g4738 [Coccomyxa elongata]
MPSDGQERGRFKRERAKLKRSRRILSQQVHEYSKQILWQASDSDEEGKSFSPRKRQAAGHVEVSRVPLLPVQSSAGAENVARESGSTSDGHGVHVESSSAVDVAAAQNVDQQIKMETREVDAGLNEPVAGEVSPVKQSPLSSTDVVPDTPTSSCGRPSAPAAPPSSTNIVRAALQRVAAQHVEQQLMQPIDAPDPAVAGAVLGSIFSRDARAHHEAGPRPSGAQANTIASMLEQEQTRTACTVSRPSPSGAALQAPVLYGAVQPVALGTSTVELAALNDISPYDIRMLAHLKRLDQKAAAMKSHNLALTEACKASVVVSPMPVRHIAFPAAREPSWQHAPACSSLPGDAFAPSAQQQPSHAAAAQLDSTIRSSGAGNAANGRLPAQMQQHGEVNARQEVDSAQVDASSARADFPAPAGPATVQIVSAPQPWLRDDVSSNGEQQQILGQVLNARREPPTVAAEQSAVSFQAISSAMMQPPTHLKQQGHPVGGRAPAKFGERAQQVGGAYLPEGLNADNGGATVGTGWIGSHMRELGLTDSIGCPHHQPAAAAPLPALQSCGIPHANICAAVMPQAVVLQATSAESTAAGGRRPVTAAEMLRLPPDENSGLSLAASLRGRDTAMPCSSNAAYAIRQSNIGFPSSAQPDDMSSMPAAVSASRQLDCLPANDPPIAALEGQPVELANPEERASEHVHGTDANEPFTRQGEHAPHRSSQEQLDVQQAPTEQALAGSAPGMVQGQMGSLGVPAAGVDTGEGRCTIDAAVPEVGDIAIDSNGESGSESDADDEALPLNSDRLPLSVGGRLAHAGSSQRHRLSVSTHAEGSQQGPPPAATPVMEASRKLHDYLPAKVVQAFSDAGFTRDLYLWQAEALNQPGVLKGRSLVFSAPTSAGKSAVAEVLMLRRLCEPRTADKVALLVLPFVSLCQEKEAHLARLLQPLEKEVRGMYSNKSGAAGINPETTGIVVCTIEKANILVNRLLEEEKMGILSCLVIDELHMVGDEQRGYLLELLLTKLRYSTAGMDEVAGEGLQIIGMSATMSNAAAFASWLDAELYETSFRPVQLRRFVKVGRQIRDEQGEPVRELAVEPNWDREDHVALLARETIDAGKSVLIFCASKKKCSDVARHVADMLGSVEERFLGGDELGDISRSDYHAELLGLADKNADLAHTFQFGVAFHHADLSHEERAIVEKAFRSGALRVLAATSTLAAGVNLPAARVIIKEWYIGLGSQWLTRSQVRQMAGRAGRAGLDDAGDAILCANPRNPRQADEIAKLIQDGHDMVDSCLIEGRKGMDRAVLEVVASKAVATKHDVKRYVQCTLLAATKDFQEVVTKAATDALRSLQERRLITWEKSSGLWGPTLLGSAVVASSLDIQDALDYKQDLDKAREGLCLDSDLHLCYLITPRSEDVCRNWQTCCDIIRSVQGVQAKVRDLVGVNMGWLTREGYHLSMRAKIPDKHRHTARVCRRFFTALVLSDVVDEVEPSVILERYGVKRFVAQQLQEQAGKHAGMMAAFCERMGWRNLEMLIAAFQSRALAGVKQEIVALTEIPHVGPASARLLFNGGLRNAETIARLPNTDTLVAILSRGHSGAKADQRKLRRFKAQGAKIRRGAIELLKQQKRNLMAEANKKLNAVRLGLEAASVTTSTPLSLPSSIGGSSTAPGSAAKAPSTSQGIQGLVAVEDSETLELVHQLWRAQERWAFTLDYRPPQPTSAASLAANDLLLPPVPVRSLPVRQQCRPEEHIRIGAVTKSAGLGAHEATPFQDTFGIDEAGEEGSGTTKVEGVAVAWNDQSAFYLPANAETWKVVARMLEMPAAHKLTHDLKPQLAALLLPSRGPDGAALRPVALGGRLVDVCIAAWLVMPDCSAVSDNPNTAGFRRGEPTGLEGLLKACMQQAPTEALNALNCSSTLPQRRREACKDAAGILRLYNHLHVVMKAEGLLKPLREVEMPLVPVLAQMEAVGVAVDPTIFAKHKRPLERRVAELDALIERAAGGPFDIASPKDVREVLFGRLRLPVPACAMKPGRKHPSTDQEVLEELASAHPVARLLQERRTLAKVLADFVNTFSHRARRASFGSPGVNGALVRIRGSFCQTSCATGRLAMEEPNLQNVPKPRAFNVEATQTQRTTEAAAIPARRDHDANIREAFVAPAGRVLLSADYAQMELRLMAHLSGDASLIATLSDPLQDPFTQWAAQWLRTPPHAVTVEQRNHAKAMAYGLLYGLGKDRLAARMGVNPQEAAQKSAEFRTSIPVLDAWLKRVVEDCRSRKFITTLAGRRRYLPDIGHADRGRRARAERQAINSTVQGSAADLCKAAMVSLADGVASAFPDAPKACRLILQIHDELLFEIEEGALPAAARLIRQCMEDAAPLTVPLRVKMSVGPSWGSLLPYTSA